MRVCNVRTHISVTATRFMSIFLFLPLWRKSLLQISLFASTICGNIKFLMCRSVDNMSRHSSHSSFSLLYEKPQLLLPHLL